MELNDSQEKAIRMSAPYVVRPDADFTEEIIRGGGDTLKQCYQCATCSVKCELSPDDRPFPRKEMIWAQWGLKDRRVGDPDVWLCHRCADCSAHCPRVAKPAAVLAAVRDFTVRPYAFPGFMGAALGRPAILPLMMLIPALLMVIVLNAVSGSGGHGREVGETARRWGVCAAPPGDGVD